MARNSKKSFWAIIGVFIILSGITSLTGDSIGWLGDKLFPLFVITLEASIVIKVAREYMS
jgi:hypothetical protein